MRVALHFFYDAAGNRTNLIEIAGTVTNIARSTHTAANRLASSCSSSSSSSAVLTNLYAYAVAGRRRAPGSAPSQRATF